MNNAAKLRALLKRPGAIKAVGAHDALSARLIERAGFDAIWASGFAISASLKCIPDASFITSSEQLEVERNIAEAVSIPIIADCDTGYGNALNVMRTVNDRERAGVAAICIEDNVYPKRCSFYAGVRRELIPIEEHCGKIKAAKAAQIYPEFVVIARTEALIAGWGQEEALKRAEAYAEAGADAVLIHSKSKKFDELKAVYKAWSGRVPLVVVPTIFDQTTAAEMEEAGAKIIIYANQPVRAAIRAMRDTLDIIKKDTRPGAANDRIVTLPEVYDIVGVPRMEEDEKQFLPVGGEKITAIIAAAGFEKQLLPLIEDKPKCLLDIKGKTILERAVGALNECNIKDIALIRGYKKEAIALPNIRYYDNDRYEDTGELYSLFCAENELKGRTLILYGDIIFDTAILEKLLKSPADIALVVDVAWLDQEQRGAQPTHLNPDLVSLAEPPGKSYLSRFVIPEGEHRIVRIGQQLPREQAHGEFIGMAMFSEKGTQAFRECYKAAQASQASAGFHESRSLSKASFTDLIQEMINRGHTVQAVPIFKGWMEVDSFEEYQKAWAKIRQ
ncbi:isocitrate lyase/phosphoenolpyruvate mutase family protein [Nitrospira moscoviensis]|uniref:Phosphoenolpyruvate mutase n=1 Tax=Nitrospira moscoviensis TaxID=42253 RepID=A0A0K2G853_NITMO|nr:isocitrate lyase/phosphoenolpyruvate mutase family protein [Nitrospira moscoviensis]ALA57034.1 Phosphoenolpyruvate mutase [Nitrospira moscoviensis]